MKVKASRALPMAVLAVVAIVTFAFWGSGEDVASSDIVEPMDRPPQWSADRDTADEQARSRVGGMVDDVKQQVSALQAHQRELQAQNAQLTEHVQDLTQQLAQPQDTLGERGKVLLARLEARLETFRDDLNRVVNRQRQLGHPAPAASSRPQGDPYQIQWVYPEGFSHDPAISDKPANPLGALADIRPRVGVLDSERRSPVLERSTARPLGETPASRPIPQYTLHDGMQLTGAVLETSLIGKIPLDGAIRDAFSFTGLIGKENLAAMGQLLPEVRGIRFRGTAIGQWGLSCVKANVESLTFLFADGTISTTRASSDTPLGLLSNRYGRTCIPGIKVGNVRDYLTDRLLVGTVGAAGEAAASAASTRTFSTQSGVMSQMVTDDTGEFIAGRALGRGMDEVADLLDRLTDDAVAAVYVDNGTEVNLLLEQQIAIDYDPAGRKLRHGTLGDVATPPRLD